MHHRGQGYDNGEGGGRVNRSQEGGKRIRTQFKETEEGENFRIEGD